jgi:hypothetical protein
MRLIRAKVNSRLTEEFAAILWIGIVMVNRRYAAVISVGILSTSLVAASAVGSWAASSGSSAGQRVSVLAFCWSTGGKVSLTPLGSPCADGARKYVIRGEQGLTGSAGETGAKGDVGARGATGADGAVGVKGDVGPAGATGGAGPRGETGATGGKGSQGAAGATGDAGPRGATGDVGAAGATGVAGPAGATGPTGATGSTGPAGAYSFSTTGEYSDTIAADGDLTLTATCTNSIDLAMSVEWDINNTNVSVVKSRRLTTDSWSVTFHNNANKSADISIWALCMNPVIA